MLNSDFSTQTTDKEGGPTMKEFWEGCNIWKAVNNSGDC